ncbi:MAG: DUF4873 domain-containing protein [Micromonosporaceae bacterium]
MPEPGDYTGPATLRIEDAELPVEVTLRGVFQPIDGRFRWYGRIAADPALDALVAGRRTAATIRTPLGDAAGDVSDQDTWGRYRIMGTGTPPFPADDPQQPGVGT